MTQLRIVPLGLDEANAFVRAYHRHHGPVVGHKFSLGVSDGEAIRGVAIVGRPVARSLDDGITLEAPQTAPGTRRAPCMGPPGERPLRSATGDW